MTPETQLQQQIESAEQYIQMYFHVVALEGLDMLADPKLVQDHLIQTFGQAIVWELSRVFTPKIPREGVLHRVNYDALKESLSSEKITIFTDDGMRSLEIRAFMSALRNTREELTFNGVFSIPTSVLLTPDTSLHIPVEEIGRIAVISRQ